MAGGMMLCRKFKLFLACCGIGIVGLAVSFLLIIPGIVSNISEAEAATEEIKEQLAEVMQYQKNHDNYEAYEKEIQDRLKILDAKIPGKLATGLFVTELQKLASERDVQLVGLVPDKAEESADFCRQVIHITVRGDFFSLVHFIRGVENSRMLVSINKYALKKTDRELECSMELRIHGDAQ